MRVFPGKLTAQDCGASGRNLLQCDHVCVHLADDGDGLREIASADEDIVSSDPEIRRKRGVLMITRERFPRQRRTACQSQTGKREQEIRRQRA